MENDMEYHQSLMIVTDEFVQNIDSLQLLMTLMGFHAA